MWFFRGPLKVPPRITTMTAPSTGLDLLSSFPSTSNMPSRIALQGISSQSTSATKASPCLWDTRQPCGYTGFMESKPDGGDHGHPVDAQRVAKARTRLPSLDECIRLTSILSLMADSTRARLLYALDVVDELCVGDLAIALDLSEDAVGYGLRLLRTAGLVTRRKEGRVVYYRLAEGFPEPLREHCLRQLLALSRTTSEDQE